MFEGIDRNHDVYKLLRVRSEDASVLNTCNKRFSSCCLEDVLANINADNALSPSFSHFNGIISFAATEIDDNFFCDLGEELVPHEDCELGLTLVSGPSAEILRSGRNPP